MRKKLFTLEAGVLTMVLMGWTTIARAEAVQATFGGQYRINAYTLSDKDGVGEKAAARARIRQNVDLKFSEQFSTHIQLNIGHVTEGIGNHETNPTGTGAGKITVGLRHAVMNYKFSEAATLVAGLVPLSDKFGDTLFSGDWDFNPLTFVLVGNPGVVDYRVAWFKMAENDETDKAAGVETRNDTSGYLLDLGADLGFAKAGAMGFVVQTPKTAADGYDSNAWVGVRADGDVAGLKWHLSGVGSSVNKAAITGKLDDASGIQILAKVDGKIGALGWGVLALNSTGDKGGEGFVSPQTLYGGQGYWGKTGILNIQGPTDTGMDANMLRTDNGGLGLTTIQASVSVPFTPAFGGYLGAGWYQANEVNAAGDKDIGTDVYTQVKYSFPNSPLSLEAGVDVAFLGKAAPNSSGATRTTSAVFARLQAQF